MAASTEVKSPCVLEIAIEGEEDVGDAEGGGKETAGLTAKGRTSISGSTDSVRKNNVSLL